MTGQVPCWAGNTRGSSGMTERPLKGCLPLLSLGEDGALAGGAELGFILFSKSVESSSYCQTPKLEQGFQG